MSDLKRLQQTTETENYAGNSAEKLPSKSARIGLKARQIFVNTAAGVTLALALEGCNGKNGGNGGEDPPPKNQPSVVANPNQKVDENSTLDINLGISDPEGVKSVSIVGGELADYFTIVDKTKLQLKSGKTLNYEADSQITGSVEVVDNEDKATEFEITINLNNIGPDDKEPQPTGEYYNPEGSGFPFKEDTNNDGTGDGQTYNYGEKRVKKEDGVVTETDTLALGAKQTLKNLRNNLDGLEQERVGAELTYELAKKLGVSGLEYIDNSQQAGIKVTASGEYIRASNIEKAYTHIKNRLTAAGQPHGGGINFWLAKPQNNEAAHRYFISLIYLAEQLAASNGKANADLAIFADAAAEKASKVSGKQLCDTQNAHGFGPPKYVYSTYCQSQQ